ncbi:hypothetical protein [Paraglaciecola sp. L3A3]|uniref:hypothetical protein n=1 Tax=Paraglaciecola sp. L3A3 TaxID=2686358 RepID=UPI00131A9CB0|nr:hypothetical protein [Paraglaciecola sp. L3A3]
MRKLIVSLFFCGLASSCSFNYGPSTEEHASESQEADSKEKISHEMQELNKMRKIKCQDAKLDLVEAEASKNIAQINLVTKRIQKYCQ